MTNQPPLDTSALHTMTSLAAALRAAGLQPGMTVLVHSSMKKIGGWICGGAEAVLHALLGVLGDDGTLMMPTHTTDNTDPALWENPPVPPAWWQIIRDETPAYHPVTTVTQHMGALPENFRRWEGVLRSAHPVGSFAAKGKYALLLTANHELSDIFGERSPIGQLYALDGWVFLLGVSYYNCTTLHLAEYRATFPSKQMITEGTAMMVDGERRWVNFEMLDLETGDFQVIGDAFEQAQPQHVQVGKVGNAVTRLIRARPLVDYGVAWMEQYRT